MKLSAFGLIKETLVLFVGNLLETNFVSSEGESYYLGKLLNPITVRCSVDKGIEPIEGVEELYIRERDALGEDWVFVDEKDPSKGFYLKGYKTDFSKGQEMCLYQSETIAEWAKGNRKSSRVERDKSINDRLKERAAARAAVTEPAEPVKPEPVANGRRRK